MITKTADFLTQNFFVRSNVLPAKPTFNSLYMHTVSSFFVVLAWLGLDQFRLHRLEGIDQFIVILKKSWLNQFERDLFHFLFFIFVLDDISKILSEEVLDHSPEIAQTSNTNKETQGNSQLLLGSLVNGNETNDNQQKTDGKKIVEDKRTIRTEENEDVEKNERTNTTDNELLEKQSKIELSESTTNKKQDDDVFMKKDKSINVTNSKIEENKKAEVEPVQEIHHEGTKNVKIEGNEKVQDNANYNLKYREVVVKPKLNGHNDVEELFHMGDLGGALETGYIVSDVLKNNITDNSNKEKINGSGRSQIIFRNHDTDVSCTTNQLNVDCFVSDESGSEYESSGETGSSEKSYDSHVPLSCKDFDNVFNAYLKARVGGYSKTDKTSLKNEPKTLDQSLKTGVTTDTSDDNTFSAAISAINASEAPHSRRKIAQDDANYARESGPLLSKEKIAHENPGHPNGVAEEGRVDANETSTDFTTIATNSDENLEETMFYGATPNDVTAYMAELPIAWTNTWYRVYDRQTKFIMKYTTFLHEN